LRKFFEDSDAVAAIPCYVEDERDISRVIADGLRAAGLSVPSEAIAHMAQNVVGDRAVARSEIDKLVTYMGKEKSVTLDDVVACVGNSASLSLDDLAKLVASGRFREAERILSSLLAEGTTAVALLRNLQYYFMRLHATKARVEGGESPTA